MTTPGNSPYSSSGQPETTGRYLVLLDTDNIDDGLRAMDDSAGIRHVAHSADFRDHSPSGEQLASEESLVFDELGVAVVTMEPGQAQALNAATMRGGSVIAVEPERVVRAIEEPDPDSYLPAPPTFPDQEIITIPVDYLKGYRDAVNHLVDRLLPQEQEAKSLLGRSDAVTDGSITWGLDVTKAAASKYSGLGLKVAVLDTGFDLTHPDFVGRAVSSKSFIDGEEVQDGNGHGTHCIGTACGSMLPEILPRYGVAYNSEIYAGKVLSNEGSGADGGILAGINWAIASGCEVISMSLGAMVLPGQRYSAVYENVGRRALRRGSLIIAAAGNDSFRQFGVIVPVSHPANCPSIMAIAALRPNLKIASFSNGGINRNGGQIDLAAPGVDVYSSWPMPTRYSTISGTSMATPHVAGLAALHAEATGARGRELWAQLTQRAWRLSLPSRDVGSGLAQAPD